MADLQARPSDHSSRRLRFPSWTPNSRFQRRKRTIRSRSVNVALLGGDGVQACRGLGPPPPDAEQHALPRREGVLCPRAQAKHFPPTILSACRSGCRRSDGLQLEPEQ